MASSRPPLSLLRLGRSLRLAVFVLVVFVMRIGTVAACVPSDIAEAFGTGEVVATVADHADEGDAKHAAGHCLHCSCHHVVTLPALPALIPGATLGFESPQVGLGFDNAPAGSNLRPPIR